MARIELDQLIVALDKRIQELEKNPIELVPQEVIENLLKEAIKDEIRNHFIYRLKLDIRRALKREFNKMHNKLVAEILDYLLTDHSLHEQMKKKIRRSMIDGIE